jgi:uroporphyrinogen III methyltransferase/synthase
VGNGICYLVGAGPGDPGLITRRGLECLRKAEVVFYDRLANEALLNEAPEEARRLSVGKRPGAHSVRQEEICQRLCDAVAEGRTVVRLKGGDPFVFGRGGEEALALAAAGLCFEVVPGVTAGIAAAAYAGIPVTHRGLSTSVTFVTGHEDPEKPQAQTDWAALARAGGTLCLYMGMGNLRQIAAALISGGRSPETPAAIVQEGTRPEQRSLTATLESLADAADTQAVSAPALVIVGAVAGLREELRWFESRPLFGKRVLITRARTQAGRLAGKLNELGAQTEELPAIRIEPVESRIPSELEQALARPEAVPGKIREACDGLTGGLLRLHEEVYDWVVLTSTNGVDAMIDRLDALGLDARSVRARIAAIGRPTAEHLRAAGLRADLVPERYVGEALFEALREAESDDLDGRRLLLLRSDRARANLRDDLRAAGAVVDDVAAYRTVPVSSLDEAQRESILGNPPEIIPFTASSTVHGFVSLMGEGGLNALLASEPRPKFVSIGPITSAAMREAGLPVDCEADDHSIHGLVEAISSFGQGNGTGPTRLH